MGKLRKNIFSYFSFESKVVLIFSLLAFCVWFTNLFFKDFITTYFVARPNLSFSFLGIFRLFSHVLGHADFEHLYSNLLLIILLGAGLEKKYGHGDILLMILVTALAIGIINAVVPFFSANLLGASGIAFMFIALTPSLADKEDGKIPVEYILVILMFGYKEIMGAFKEDQIAQFAHLIGGACGVLFGFLLLKLNRKEENKEILGG